MSRTTGRRARLACAIGALAMLTVTACTAEPPPPPTLRVDRGTVATTVSASGTLVGISEQNLGFPAGGQLVEVLVGVGERVEPGQVLARIDDFELLQTLEEQQAELAQAQAELDRAEGGNSVKATGRTLDQAKKILDAVKKEVDEINDLNEAATDRARKQLDFDKKVLRRAEDQLRRDLEACDGDDDPAPTTTPRPNSEGRSNDDDGDDDESSVEVTTRVEGASVSSTPSSACDRIPGDRDAVDNAKRTVLASETELETAKRREDVDKASGRVTVEREEQTVISAENDRGAAENDRPADINVQEAAVRNAQASVAIAQRNVDNTVLHAPVAGVVSAINGRAGEYVGDGSGTTPVAPGTSASIPQTSDLAGGDNGGAATGGSAFMVLNNIDSFQLVVPFEESDASRIAPNQEVEVTVDAIPDLRAPATVLAVAPAGDPSSGIVEYYATIVLSEGSDARLRDGQTALADVLVESVDNVLRVPSAAVRRDAQGTVVDVRGEDGEPVATPFTAGALGDEYTQVLSGLREGQELLLPEADAS